MKYIISENQLNIIKESLEINKVKLPDFLIHSIEQHKTSLGKHDAFPPEDETKFEEKILKKRYFELLNYVKKVDGVDGDISTKNLLDLQVQLINKCKKIETPIKEELEKLCFEIVNNMFGIEYGDLDIECVLKDKIESKVPITPKPMLDTEFEDVKQIDGLTLEIMKRRLINSIVQGASVRISSNYTNIVDKLYALDHRLPQLYHDTMAVSEFLSFVKEMKPTKDNIGGAVYVDLSDEDPTIYSEAIIFPILIFETVKGVMELLSSHGLPENKKDADYIISKADFLLVENWDKRFGVGLWDILMDRLNHNNFDIMPSVFIELVSIPVEDFNKYMREIFAGTKKGKKIINDIVDNINSDNNFKTIESTIANKNKEQYFTPEELINSNELNETDTFSAGNYTYDAPAFLDDETSDHSNLIAKSVKDGLNEEDGENNEHGDYENDGPPFVDKEVGNHKNMILRSEKDELKPGEKHKLNLTK